MPNGLIMSKVAEDRMSASSIYPKATVEQVIAQIRGLFPAYEVLIDKGR